MSRKRFTSLMTSKTGYLMVVLSLFLPIAADSKEVLQPESINLVIKHHEPSVIEYVEGKNVSRLSIDSKDTITFEIGRGKNVTVSIVDPNPLLYDYKVGEVVKEKTEDYTAILTFAKTLEGLAGALKTTRALVEPEVADFGLAIKNVSDFFSKVPDWTKRSYSTPDTVKQEVQTQFLNAHITDSIKIIRETLPTFRKRAADILQNKPCDPNTQFCDERIVTFALLQESTLLKMADAIEVFRDKVDQINVPMELKQLNYSGTEKQTFTTTISKSVNWPKDFKNGRKTGDIELSVVPHSPVRLEVGGAVIYSFVRDPNFTAERQNDGSFIIRQSDNDYKAIEGAVVLAMTPRALDFPAFSIPIQIGVTPKDNVGIYLGAGIKAQSLFSFGAGIAFQQGHELAPGLAPNQTISSADKLKTEKVFRTGFYLHLTVTLTGK